MATVIPLEPSTTDVIPDSGLPPAILRLLYFPSSRASAATFPELLQDIRRETTAQVELAITTIAEDDPGGIQRQAAFRIERRPAIMVARLWPGEASREPVERGDLLAFGILEEQAIWQDPPRLIAAVANLVRVFASSTPREMEAALRNRRFRMLVWQASARSGEALAYFTDLQLSLGVRGIELSLAFDADGWSTAA